MKKKKKNKKHSVVMTLPTKHSDPEITSFLKVARWAKGTTVGSWWSPHRYLRWSTPTFTLSVNADCHTDPLLSAVPHRGARYGSVRRGGKALEWGSGCKYTSRNLLSPTLLGVVDQNFYVHVTSSTPTIRFSNSPNLSPLYVMDVDLRKTK